MIATKYLVSITLLASTFLADSAAGQATASGGTEWSGPENSVSDTGLYPMFVSPTGDDRNDGSVVAPLRTLTEARDRAVEANNRLRSGKGVVIYLREGYYQLLSPLVLKPEHSGRPGAPIVFKSFPGERAALHGGYSFIEGVDGTWVDARIATIRGSQTVKKFVFAPAQAQFLKQAIARIKAPWIDARGIRRQNNAGKFAITQLFSDGRRQTRSRHPNVPIPGDTRLLDAAAPCPFNPPPPRLPGYWIGVPSPLTAPAQAAFLDGRTEVVFTKQFEAYRALVTAASAHAQSGRTYYKLLLNPSPRERIFPGYWCGHGYEQGADESVWFENNRAFLDTPGEWYVDEDSDVPAVYYVPRPGQDLSNSIFTIPLAYSLVKFNDDPPPGSPRDPVHDVYFQDLDLLFTNWRYKNSDGHSDWIYSDLQGGNSLEGAIDGTGFVDRIAFNRCRFGALGSTAIALGELRLGRPSGGASTNVVIQGNSFNDIGGAAIRFDDSSGGKPTNLRIHGNRVAWAGRVFLNATAILVVHATSSTVTANSVQDVPYVGITVGNNTNRWSPSDRHIVHGNIVTRAMSFLRDGGGMYISTQNGVFSSNSVTQTSSARWPGAPRAFLTPDTSSTNWPSACGFYFDAYARHWVGNANHTDGALCTRSKTITLAKRPGEWDAPDVYGPIEKYPICRNRSEKPCLLGAACPIPVCVRPSWFVW